MPDCASCGSALGDPIRQPAERGPTTEAEHYRCPGCGAGGYRVVDGRRVLRSGGPAFTEPTDRDRALEAADRDPLTAVPDGGKPPADRKADALERIAGELEYQNAVLCEIARQIERLQRPLWKETEVPLSSPKSLQSSIDDHRITREEVEHP